MEHALNLQSSSDVLAPSEARDRSISGSDSREYDLDSLVRDLDRLLPEPTSIREKLLLIEAEMLKAPQEIFPVEHIHADGIYAREIKIPKGALVMGAIHKTEHVNVISQGEITILTEDGVRKIKAPCTILSRPGTKKLGYAHEDTVWTTFHSNPTNKTNVADIEEDLVAKTFDDPDLIKNMKLKLVGDSPCLWPLPLL